MLLSLYPPTPGINSTSHFDPLHDFLCQKPMPRQKVSVARVQPFARTTLASQGALTKTGTALSISGQRSTARSTRSFFLYPCNSSFIPHLPHPHWQSWSIPYTGWIRDPMSKNSRWPSLQLLGRGICVTCSLPLHTGNLSPHMYYFIGNFYGLFSLWDRNLRETWYKWERAIINICKSDQERKKKERNWNHFQSLYPTNSTLSWSLALLHSNPKRCSPAPTAIRNKQWNRNKEAPT